ncbi:cation:proton antiporter [uncultured Salinisphaera sp.]|uniref:monovalent cation:proton antiporter family protein n=1 Tax=uncultured Salinisphaera sp. TaxID=359372 RepID=UPI0032B1E774|tara:strand:+ start:2394 stop:4247 length:1854 start_codon:yes stop_codon:yes gene_type:complete
MESGHISFLPLLIVIALSFAVPILLSPIRRLGIPVVVGEIIAGIVVGRSGLGLVGDEFVLEVLSVFGFAYLMFLSGLEIDFSGLSARGGLRASTRAARLRRNPFVIGGVAFALTTGCSLLGAFYLTYLGLVDQPWLMALILSTTSLGVVAPVLKERGVIESTFGQTLLAAALIADFVTILLVSGFAMVRAGAALDLLLILVLLIVFVAAYRLAERARHNLPAQRLMHALSTATSQIRVRGSMALALVFIALAEGLGVENILGAFLAGVLVSFLVGSESSLLREKLDAIGYGFFIPIFFVMVGVQFDLPALLGSDSPWATVGLLLAIAFGVKLVGSMAFRLAFGWRETFAASTLLSARLSLIIAVAAIGVEMGIISPALDAAIILVAIVTCLCSPIAFSRLVPRSYRKARHMLLIGDTRDTGPLAARLREIGRDVAVHDIGHHDAPVDVSRSRLSTALRTAGIEGADTVIALADDDETNLAYCRVAREVHGVQRQVAWVRDPAFNKRFRDAGVSVVNPAYAKFLLLESLAVGGSAMAGLIHDDDNQEIRIAKLANPWLADRPIRHIGLPEGTRVLRIQRGDAVLEAEPSTQLRINDTLTVIGAHDEVDALVRRLASRW